MEAECEEIRFDEIGGWLDARAGKISEDERRVFGLIRVKMDLFDVEISEKIGVLEGIDVEAKKVEGRTKIIVKQGLDRYLEFVRVFMKELAEVEKENLERFIGDTNKIFANFDKRSYLFYQRANYLIGDELLAVRTEISDLSKYFSGVFDENHGIVNSSSVISSIRLKLKELYELDVALNKINFEIKNLGVKVVDGEERGRKLSEEIERIKASGEYAESLGREAEIKLAEKELGDDFSRLKVFVDFKALSNVFHSDEKKMDLIKSYRDDFRKSIVKDGGRGILDLMRGAGLNVGVVVDKIKLIDGKRRKISESKGLVDESGAEMLSGELEKMKSEVESLSIEKVKCVGRGRSLEKRKKEIRELVGLGVKELGGEIIS